MYVLRYFIYFMYIFQLTIRRFSLANWVNKRKLSLLVNKSEWKLEICAESDNSIRQETSSLAWNIAYLPL